MLYNISKVSFLCRNPFNIHKYLKKTPLVVLFPPSKCRSLKRPCKEKKRPGIEGGVFRSLNFRKVER